MRRRDQKAGRRRRRHDGLSLRDLHPEAVAIRHGTHHCAANAPGIFLVRSYFRIADRRRVDGNGADHQVRCRPSHWRPRPGVEIGRDANANVRIGQAERIAFGPQPLGQIPVANQREARAKHCARDKVGALGKIGRAPRCQQRRVELSPRDP
eukprot:scaffold23804_cov128-Isochrysis_galbana.AAC.3